MIRMLPTFRLLTSVGVIFGVLAAVAGVSSALFTSDPATASANTFTTGSANLSIAPDSAGTPGTYGSSITGANITGLTPGESATFVFWLKNDSTDTLELDLFADLANITANGDLGSMLKVQFTCDNKTNNSSQRDGDTTSKSLTTWGTDVAEQMNQGTDTTPGRLGASGAANGSGSDEAKCTMTATLDPASNSPATNATFDAVFTGTQVAGT